jgi:transcriptional regulator with XRE-family HTH domain
MKSSASARALPYAVEDALVSLGKRVSLARRARLMTQKDLAEKAGIGVSTIQAIERGSPSVQIGFTLSTLWALGLEGTFEFFMSVGADHELTSMMADTLPQRISSKRRAP